MGLFRSKKDKDALADVFQEVKRAQSLAAQSTTQVEQQMGMSVADMQARATAMTQGDGMASLQAYAARSARLSQAGVDTPAVLRGVQLGPPSPWLGGTPAQLQVTVEPPGRASYDVHTDQVVTAQLADLLVPGTRLTVRVDPDDPNSLLIWGTSQAAPADDADARLAKLRQLLTTGVLTPEEYDAQVQKLSSKSGE